ncbi:UNVERIFIED_CONTAM: Pre-splicing factor CLF1, partial [Sesamum radiatum]
MANARDSDLNLGYLTKKETEKITDATELGDYRLRKRKEFEDLIRRVRWNKSVWVKYAKWEESQKDYARARSVWERALEVDYRDHTLWLKYADFEMKNKFVNHARNVWDRATQLLPRVDQLWYKYIHMEEMLGNVAGARQIFERWMKWAPDQQGWLSYIKFELRAVDKLGDDEEAEELFVAFAEFEEKCKETERARCIYKEGIEDAIVGKRRFQYEDEVRKNPLNYDAWFDYIRLEESCGDKQRIEDVYERAIANIPPAQEKRYWQRYIYLRINYVLYEELDAQDVDRTRDVY